MVWGCEQVATCRLGLTIREAVKPEDFHELNPFMYVCKAVIAYYLIHSLAGSAALFIHISLLLLLHAWHYGLCSLQ